MVSVLLIEDSPSSVELITRSLGGRSTPGHRIEIVPDLRAAIEKLASYHFDIALLDLNLPDSQGIATFDELRHAAPDLPIIVVTGEDDPAMAALALEKGAQDYLVKTSALNQILPRAFRYAIEREKQRAELNRRIGAIQESHARSRAVLDATADAIVVIDKDRMACFANPAAAAMFQRSIEQLIGQPFGFVASADASSELDIVRRDGTSGVAEMRVTTTIWEGQPAVLAALRDVTERRASEQRLRQSEAHFEAAQRIAGVGSYVRDLRTGTVTGTEQFYRIFGLDPCSTEDWDRYWDHAVSEEDRAGIELSFKNAGRGKKTPPSEYTFRRADGAMRTALRTIDVVCDDDGNPASILGVVHDITEGRIAEAHIRLLQRVSLAIAEADSLQAALEVVLRETCQMAGWRYAEAWMPDSSGEELTLAAHWHDGSAPLVAIAENARSLRAARGVGARGRVWQTGRPERINGNFNDWVHPDRAALWEAAELKSLVALPMLSGTEALATIVFGMTEAQESEQLLDTFLAVAAQLGSALGRKRAEDSLKKSAGLLDAAMSVAQLGSWTVEVTTDGAVEAPLEWSHEMFRICGVPEDRFDHKPATYYDLMHPDDREEFRRSRQHAIQSTACLTHEHEHRIIRPDGVVRWVRTNAQIERDIAGLPVRMLGVLDDVTDQRRALSHVRLLQRASLAIAEAENLEAALRIVLRETCELAGWRYAEAWVPDQLGEELTLAATWHDGGATFVAMAENAHGLKGVTRGVGAPGRVWATGQPERLNGDFREFVYRESAALWAKAGLKSLYTLPIRCGTETLAALVFAMANEREAGAPVLDTICAVAAQLANALARKGAEDSLKKSAALLEAAMSVAQLGSWTVQLTPDGVADGSLEWSRETFRICGLSEDSFDHKGSTFYDLVHPDDRKQFRGARARWIEGEPDYELEYRIIRPDGAVRWVRTHRKVERDTAGTPIRMLGVLSDITDQRAAQAHVHLLQRVSLAIAEAENLEAALGTVLREACEMAGWHYAEAWVPDQHRQEMAVVATWHTEGTEYAAVAEDAGKLRAVRGVGAIGRVWESGYAESLSTPDRSKYPESAALWTKAGLKSLHAMPIRSGTETLAALAFGMSDDGEANEQVLETIAAVAVQLGSALGRRRAEDSSKRNAALLEAALSVAQLGSWTGSDLAMPDPDQGRIEWSAQTYKIWGQTEGAFDRKLSTYLSLVHPEDREEVRQMRQRVIDGDGRDTMEHRIVRPDGTIRWIRVHSAVERDAAGSPLRLFGVSQDITEERSLVERLLQAQKMEAIGNLTGGMAHDFNNLLGVITGNLGLARERLGSDEELLEMVDDALDAAWRGADLTRRLLAFARQQPLRPERIDLNKLVNDIMRLMRRVLGEDVEISLSQGDGIWPVTTDPAQLESALVNLAANARDAMPRGGKLIISTANRKLDADYAAMQTDLIPGDFAMIEVSDTGTGISAETLSRIFEPFFTTKEPGKGTGLGLSMVFGFMRQSGGHINVYSELGAGTTFRLFFPRAAADTSGHETSDTRLIAHGGSETILIVEDNPDMRRVALRQLRGLGYRVIECDRAIAALEILQRESVDLLFTDIVMPGGLDGAELARQARQRWPALKIVLTSGFPQARIAENSDAVGDLKLLNKPYAKDELAAALRAALDG